MPSGHCFDAPTLKDYLLGRLSEEQSDVVAAHLEACLQCEATISQLDRASDTLTNGLRLPAVAADPQTDDELQKALNKVRSLEALAENPTSEVSADRSPILRDYRLLEPLGSGGMGQVFKAVHTRLDRLVAVKLLPARRLGDEQAVARFQREMRVIGQLSHPAIVQATDAGEVDGTHFLVMEFVEGCDLNTLAKACGPLSIADACEITRQAALGLEYAHQQGIVHRDIKPSNLMLTSKSEVGGRKSEQNSAGSISEFRVPNSPFVKILDLGLALLSGEQAPVDELTTVGQLMGTLDYMAPEQLEDSHLVGPRADIYALAATLFRLLTGVAPFAKEDRKTPLQKLRALATQTAPPIRERRADLPEELAAIIDRALQRDPAERFASMTDFAAVLAPWCAGHALAALAQTASENVVVRENPVGHVFNLPVPNAAFAGNQDRSSDAHVRTHLRPDVGVRSTNSLPAGQVENLPHGPARRSWLVALAVLFLAAFGVVITIQTNKGTLIVESVRDNVEVRVKKSGRVVEKLEVSKTAKSTKLAAGEYEIELVGEADGLQIQNGKFVLKRGDTVVAKVTEVPIGQTSAVRADDTTVEKSAKPADIVDRNAKGMETFEGSNLELAGEKKIREALQQNIDIGFADTPLTDVLLFLEDRTQIKFFLEVESLTEEGIPSDQPITLSLIGKPTASVLEFLLRPIQLAWYIDGGQVVVTTMSKEKEVFVTRTYPVGKLLPGVNHAVERLRFEPPAAAGNANKGDRGGGGVNFGGPGGGFYQISDTTPLSVALPLVLGQFGGGGGAPAPAQGQPPPVIPTDASHIEELLSESLGHSWMKREGEGGTCELLHNVLVVRHTRRAHADIEALLRAIEAAFLKPLAEPAEIRPAGYSLEADATVRRQLARPLDAAFTDTPVSDVAHWLSDQLGVQVWLDLQAFTEEGIPADTPVTLQLPGVTGEVLLSRLTKPLRLAYVVEHGVLIVTTASKQRERLVTKVYDVRDLLDRGLPPNRLIAGLHTTTPGPWQSTDGEGGTLTLFADTLLIVRQTGTCHDEVAKFLTSLGSQLNDQPKAPRVVKTQPKQPTSETPPATRPKPTQSITQTNPPTKPAADPNQPRYDGKSFDEWLAILDTERSPARLADAIEALRLLGRDSHADQIAERVLKIARVVDASQAIYGATFKLFSNLPDAVAQRAFANELRNGTSRSRRFVLEYMNYSDKLESDEYVTAVLNVCRDNDPEVRMFAVARLASLPLEGNFAQHAAQRTTQLRQSLADTEPRTVLRAAFHLLDSEADSKTVAEALARIVAKPASPDQRMEALNLIAVMGPRAASVASKVADVLLEKGTGEDIRITLEFALTDNEADRWLARFRDNYKSTWHFATAVALARMGKQAAEVLPKIDELTKGPIKGDEDREFSTHEEHVPWQALLRAARTRIETPPAFDLRNGDLMAITTALHLVAWNHKLVKMEQALLHQYRGKNDPSLEELAGREQNLYAAYGFLSQLRNWSSTHRKAGRNPKLATATVNGLISNLKQPDWGTEAQHGTLSAAPIGLTIQANSLRVTVIMELGRFGAAARDALPVLKKELESKDKSVTAAAEKAIKQIESAKDDTKE